MIKLTDYEKQILVSGVKYQFNIWKNTDPVTTSNTYEHNLIEQINTDKLPSFSQMDPEDQWDLMCALYCAYGNSKIMGYSKSDVAKLNKKITNRSMQFTVGSINEAWDDVE